MCHSIAALECPANSVYNHCTNPCQETCTTPGRDYSMCSQVCYDGCECVSSFVLSGNQCIPKDQCGCMDGGRYYAVSINVFSGSKVFCKLLACCTSVSLFHHFLKNWFKFAVKCFLWLRCRMALLLLVLAAMNVAHVMVAMWHVKLSLVVATHIVDYKEVSTAVIVTKIT